MGRAKEGRVCAHKSWGGGGRELNSAKEEGQSEERGHDETCESERKGEREGMMRQAKREFGRERGHGETGEARERGRESA